MVWLRAWFSKTVRESRDLKDHINKLLQHQRDLLTPAAADAVAGSISRLHQTLRSGGDDAAIVAARKDLEETATKHLRAYPNAGIRDWIDTVLVAGGVALTVRTIYCQPMEIPTGSAQPSFYGIEHEDLRSVQNWQKPPLHTRIWDKVVKGHTYAEAIARQDGYLERVEQAHVIHLGPIQFFKRLKLYMSGDSEPYTVPAPSENELIHLGISQYDDNGRPRGPMNFKKGQPIVRCILKSGDKLFVNRVAYNFRHPKRGETIVFRSEQHPGMTANTHYIKRLVGLGGERIRVGDDRHTYINGVKLDKETPGFEGVYSFDPAQPPQVSKFSGHVNGTIWRKAGRFGDVSPNFPDDKTEQTIRPGHLVCFGDNTMNSADSRAWGQFDFPQTQVVGKSAWVIWPFSSRWGWHQK